MNIRFTRHLAAFFAIGLIAGPARVHAQSGESGPNDPNSLLSNTVLTVPFKDYSIAGLVTHLPDTRTFKYGIALFPGYPSIMKLRDDAGQPRFDLGGNFLIRSRRHWLDEETLVIAVDAPSDQWSSFNHLFRQEPRYAADVAALLAEATRRYGVADWTLVGHSEGTVSAFHAARLNPALVRRLILTSSLLLASGKGPGLSGVSWEGQAPRLLWVHHAADPCAFTPYRSAQQAAEASRSPLLTVRGGDPARSAPCESRSAHGFVGVERETVLAMRSWARTGITPGAVVKE